MDLEEELGPGLGATSPAKGPATSAPLVHIDIDGDDLYAGLAQGSGIESIQLAQERARADALQQELEALRVALASLQEEHGVVRQERDALLTNISSLYNTAKLEIGRKDGEIKDLRASCD
ncbi:hypothetical protein QBZ16_000542 [Prototheca wickerhamii]|uniref:Uncharacterized protein n=1 Tax=Prototheca wickerhamii TaxID=3111 RepID=A0AAD9MN42_PROWI|nr:hypothetical protein QBZ16_000542 [Prototheca wickerhamii]